MNAHTRTPGYGSRADSCSHTQAQTQQGNAYTSQVCPNFGEIKRDREVGAGLCCNLCSWETKSLARGVGPHLTQDTKTCVTTKLYTFMFMPLCRWFFTKTCLWLQLQGQSNACVCVYMSPNSPLSLFSGAPLWSSNRRSLSRCSKILSGVPDTTTYLQDEELQVSSSL